MKIDLPRWQSEYESKITQLAYEELQGRAQNKLDRLLLILERYRETKDDALYNLFWATLEELRADIKLLSRVVGSHWFENKAFNLATVAEMVAWEEPNYFPTMLFDLVGCLRSF